MESDECEKGDHDGKDHGGGKGCEHLTECPPSADGPGWYCHNCNCRDLGDAMQCDMCGDDHDGHDHEGPPACVAECIEQTKIGDDAMKEMSEDAAMTAMEDAYKEMCVCDTSKCDADELEEVKEVIGFVCCNPDFVSGSSLVANGECDGVMWGDFTEFTMMMKDDDDHDDDHDGHDHDHHDDDMGSGYGYGYGFVEEEIVRDVKPECEGVCPPGVCDNADDAYAKEECYECKVCHEPPPERTIHPDCDHACPVGVCDNADDAENKPTECAECHDCHKADRPDGPGGDRPHDHPEM